ncbi:MAG: glutamate racemase [Bacteroidota bacterium]|nr:glutamate racemase [Bacteroidota bacterium]
MSQLQTSKRKHPIGVFDSGVGGLTVFKSIVDKLPIYDYIYLGDNARVPYGTRSFDTVYKYTLEGITKLYELGCRLVIIACNTASAKALRTIQQNDLLNFDEPFKVLGVIRPTVEELGEYSKTRHVGVFATPGTVISNSYPLEIQKLYADISVFQQACPMWVPLVENNLHNTEGGQYFIKENINQLLIQSSEIDTIILGCTHYPILLPLLNSFVPKHIKILTQGEIVSNKLEDYLYRHPEIEVLISMDSKRTFFTTEDPQSFNNKAHLFINLEVSSLHIEN